MWPAKEREELHHLKSWYAGLWSLFTYGLQSKPLPGCVAVTMYFYTRIQSRSSRGAKDGSEMWIGSCYSRLRTTVRNWFEGHTHSKIYVNHCYVIWALGFYKKTRWKLLPPWCNNSANDVHSAGVSSAGVSPAFVLLCSPILHVM